MSYSRSNYRSRRRRHVALSGSGENRAVYDVVRKAADTVRGFSVSPVPDATHPGMTVTPIHRGMTVTPIAGFLDSIFDPWSAIQDAACDLIGRANKVQYDSQMQQIRQLYVKPDDYYDPQQVLQLVSAVMNVINTVHNAVMQLRAQYDVAALAYMENEFNSIGQDSLKFIAAAQSGAETVQSSGLSTWALDSLETASDNMGTLAYVACQKPWWLDTVASFQSYFDVVKSVIAAIVAFVVKVGQTIAKVPSTIDDIVTAGLWLGGAFLAFKVYQAFSRDSR